MGKSLHKQTPSSFQNTGESFKHFFQCAVKWPFRAIILQILGQIYPVNLEAIKTMKHHNMELGNSNETIAFK